MILVPPWSNQNLSLHHGTDLPSARNILEKGVDVQQGKFYRDFGQGFYCTTLVTQAREWSIIKAQRLKGVPAVVQFSLPREELSKVSSLVFVLGNPSAFDFWNFVQFCRAGGQAHARHFSGLAQPYDVVYGPVAQNWESLKQKPDADQISFHTTAAQRLLNIVASRRMLEP